MDLLHLGECDKVPDFCRGKGLCLNTHNPRLTHCQCERGSFGRHCEFNGTNSWTLIILQSNQTTFNKISVRKLWIFFLGWAVMSISIGSVCMVGEYMYTSYDMRELKTSLSHGSPLTRPQDTAYTILHFNYMYFLFTENLRPLN